MMIKVYKIHVIIRKNCSYKSFHCPDQNIQFPQWTCYKVTYFPSKPFPTPLFPNPSPSPSPIYIWGFFYLIYSLFFVTSSHPQFPFTHIQKSFFKSPVCSMHLVELFMIVWLCEWILMKQVDKRILKSRIACGQRQTKD